MVLNFKSYKRVTHPLQYQIIYKRKTLFKKLRNELLVTPLRFSDPINIVQPHT